MTDLSSGVAFIDVTQSDPLALFNEWQEEAIAFKHSTFLASTMCLATVSSEGDISNRNLVVLEKDNDGFVFMTNKNSRKMKDIEHNPKVASTFLWSYEKEGVRVVRQVRIQGIIEEIDNERSTSIFNNMPLFVKLRSHICNQGEEVVWDELKKKHDLMLKDVLENNIELKLPDYQGFYKLIPNTMEFYYTFESHIADRIKFSRVNGEWKYVRISA